MGWEPTDKGYRYPLSLWVVWHEEGTESREPNPCYRLARALYDKLGGEWIGQERGDEMQDAFFGGLSPAEVELPVFFHGTPSPATSAIDRALELQPSERVVVLLIIDLQMWGQRSLWKPVVNHLSELDERTEAFKFVAVSATSGAHDAFAVLKEKKALRVETDNLESSGRFYSEVMALLCKQLYGESLPPVFLSHATQDGSEVAQDLYRYIDARSDLEAWLDKTKISAGENIRAELESSIPNSFFVAIATEHYVKRRWTRWEASLARRHDCPMVVVDAIEGTLRRLPPELSNAPMIRWSPSSQDMAEQVPTLVLAELLSHTYHRLNAEIIREVVQDTQLVIPTLLPPGPPRETQGQRQVRIYADPPLTEEELELQSQAEHIRFMTVTQYVSDRGWKDGVGWKDGDGSDAPPLRNLRIGVSVSSPRTAREEGLYEEQINDLSVRLARNLVFLGADLAYGGDLRPGGLTSHLARIVDLYAPARVVGDVLRAYISWPFWKDWGDEEYKERLKQSEPIPVDPPPDIPRDKKFDWGDPKSLIDFARALTWMRRRMTRECGARVSIGGPVAGSKGRMPGIVEEVLMALAISSSQQEESEVGELKPRPVYLVAGFGGATEAIFDCLEGKKPVKELSLEYQAEIWPQYASIWSALKGTADEVDWTWIKKELADFGLDGLAELNGLSPEENLKLASTRNPREIGYWIAKGLGATFGQAQEK